MNLAEVEGEVCEGEKIPTVYVDLADCGCVVLKQDDDWIDLPPRMLAALADALAKQRDR